MAEAAVDVFIRDRWAGIINGTNGLDPRDAELFLGAICRMSTKLERILASSAGSSALRVALTVDTSPDFINGSFTRFVLAFVNSDPRYRELDQTAKELCSRIIRIPLLWRGLVSHVKARTLDQAGFRTFALLLLNLLYLPLTAEILDVAQDDAVQHVLLVHQDERVRRRGDRIVEALRVRATTIGPRLETRSDVDHSHIQNLPIFPTAEELNSHHIQFDPPPEISQSRKNSDDLRQHISTHFRMLRDDMIRDLRDELNTLTTPRNNPKSLLVKGFKLVDISCNGKNPFALQLQCSSALPSPRKKHRRKRRAHEDEDDEDDDEAISNPFLDGFVVCLLVNHKVVAVGKMIQNERLACRTPPSICVQICPTDLAKTLLRLKVADQYIDIFQSSTVVFAHEPVLKSLQQMRYLPGLVGGILSWSSGKRIRPTTHKTQDRIKSLIEALSSNPDVDLKPHLGLEGITRLDKAQGGCLIAALGQALAIVQSPPATSKSFLGCLVARAIHHHTKELVLIVCATNHTVNSTIKELVDMRVPKKDIVRLGSGNAWGDDSKNFSTSHHRHRNERLFENGEHISRCKVKLQNNGQYLQAESRHFMNRDGGPKRIMAHLRTLNDDSLPFVDAFQVPSSGLKGHIGEDGKLLSDDYLLSRWIDGKDAGAFSTRANEKFASIWQLPKSAREYEYLRWMQKLHQTPLDRIIACGTIYNTALSDIAAVYSENDGSVLRDQRIIVCTVTTAALSRSSLEIASPAVLIVHEAGKITEARILAALTSNIKQLVLIGDHAQPRPECHFDLSAEKGDGHDLNKTMMERLIQAEFPYRTLTLQDRMRPEISHILRSLSYPSIVDSEKTCFRKDVPGLQDNVIFIDHEEPETVFDGLFERGERPGTPSRQNIYEAKLLHNCLRHLTQQGNRSEDMVVLTPYLGQLRVLVDQLQNSYYVVLNERDSRHLFHDGEIPRHATPERLPLLRISTIDHYQGESRDIVIVSLVRSNQEQDIGLMSTPQRFNFVLSRAKDGLIVIGNSNHFVQTHSGELWQRFINIMKTANHIYAGLPVRCAVHTKRTLLLHHAELVNVHCPDCCAKRSFGQGFCRGALECRKHFCSSVKCHFLSKDDDGTHLFPAAPTRIADKPVWIQLESYREHRKYVERYEQTLRCHGPEHSFCQVCSLPEENAPSNVDSGEEEDSTDEKRSDTPSRKETQIQPDSTRNQPKKAEVVKEAKLMASGLDQAVAAESDHQHSQSTIKNFMDVAPAISTDDTVESCEQVLESKSSITTGSNLASGSLSPQAVPSAPESGSSCRSSSKAPTSSKQSCSSCPNPSLLLIQNTEHEQTAQKPTVTLPGAGASTPVQVHEQPLSQTQIQDGSATAIDEEHLEQLQKTKTELQKRCEQARAEARMKQRELEMAKEQEKLAEVELQEFEAALTDCTSKARAKSLE